VPVSKLGLLKIDGSVIAAAWATFFRRTTNSPLTGAKLATAISFLLLNGREICGNSKRRALMTSAKQRLAARRNVRKAAASAKRKRTINKLPKKTRTALGKQGARVAKRNRRG
jgi:hypothetical protein